MEKNRIYFDWTPAGEVKKPRKKFKVFIPEHVHEGHLPGVPN